MQQLDAHRIIMGEQKMDNLKAGLFVAVDYFSYMLSPVKKSIGRIMSGALWSMRTCCCMNSSSIGVPCNWVWWELFLFLAGWLLQKPVEDPEGMTKIIVEALRKTGQRGIIGKGWGGIGNSV
jgi:hypothetical protein